MKKILIGLLLLIAATTYGQDNRSICVQLNALNDKILEGKIKKQDAIHRLRP